MLSAVLPGLDRKSFTLSTKVGVKLVPYRGGPPLEVNSFNSSEPWRSSFDFSRESVKCTLEGSLERLKLNRVDIVYIHDPDEGVTLLTPSADPRSKSHYSKVMGETLPYLHELKRQKIISAIGVGINQHEMLCDFAKEGQGIFDVFLLAHRITLLDHLGFVRELLPLCQEKGISLVAGSVSHRGILLTGSRPKDGSQPYFNLGSASPEIISKVEGIEVVCKEYGVPLMSAALQFPTLFKPVDSVLVGVKDTRELMEDVEYFERRLPTDFWRELKHKELIASEIDIAE